MNRLALLFPAALLLAACSTLPAPAPVPTPTPLPAPGPSPLADRTLDLGTALTLGTEAPFTGTSWRVEDTPAWLTVSPSSGTGALNVQVRANRALGTPVKADQARLTGEVKIAWQAGERSGTATWTVTADQYVLTGRVTDPTRVQGGDVGTAPAEDTDPAEVRSVIVKYRSAAAQALALGRGVTAQDAALASTRAALTEAAPQARHDLGGRRAELVTDDVAGTLAALRRDPNVEYAVPNAVLRAQATAAPLEPTDEYAGLQWAYRLLGYRAVWRDMESGGYTRPVTVAVVDSGVRYDHPDLAGALLGPDQGALDVLAFVPADQKGAYDNGDGDGPDRDPSDPGTPARRGGSHGTHVSGIIAARWGTTEPFPGCAACSTSGVAGAAYKAPVKVLPIRAIDAQGNTEVSDVVSAVRYAAGLPVTLGGQTYRLDRPVPVINLSLGGDISASQAAPLCEAVAEATAAGTLVFAAAGNGYGTTPYYPAACEGAVAVGAVTLSGASAPLRASYSNQYPAVQLAAPGGVDLTGATYHNGGQLNGKAYADVILSTDWDYGKNQPTYMGQAGTSQATPQVSALAALLLSKGVTQGRDDTLARLTATATDLGAKGRDEAFGYGMVNAAAALNAPAVSDTLGLRLWDTRGLAYQPALDALGRFTAYLPDGTFRALAGRDRDGNGIYGEAHEPGVERDAELGPERTRAELGELTLVP
ncbi:subtilisin family serine protease [Deinococcus sp. HSC-46F16]|uniref:S8 family serine peptidase n=1 Tax=Deinococcus sp. HSC-46F16 TaxID=2910968 RepID=UPI0020A01A72|nr:S8 family serine peptidase [Deinococcus sp. HSC-46F16]MCP2013478.1 subtilisin family serine protease [Deinococcus sp. HSC-46F16]